MGEMLFGGLKSDLGSGGGMWPQKQRCVRRPQRLRAIRGRGQGRGIGGAVPGSARVGRQWPQEDEESFEDGEMEEAPTRTVLTAALISGRFRCTQQKRVEERCAY